MSDKILTRDREKERKGEKHSFILSNGIWDLPYDEIWPHSRYRKAICRENGHSRRAFTPSVWRLRHPVLHQPLHCMNPISRVRIYDVYYSHPQPHLSMPLSPFSLAATLPPSSPLDNRGDVRLFKSSYALMILIIPASSEDRPS